MEKEKKFMIIGVLILLITLVGAAGTYAWFTWSSANNTNLTMSIGASSDVIFKNGNDISTNKLAPVFNYTDGESTSFTITNKSTTSFSYRISLNITSIDNELKNKTLKYKLVSNNTIITEGNFSNIESNSKNTLYEGELSKGNISYIFYLYIDGNEENNLNMINKSLVGTITVAEATATYQLTNEDGTSYTPSYSGSGTKVVRSNAALSKFKEVRVDGVTVDSFNYTLSEGSTIVTFKESYLKTLSVGEHALKIISNDGFAIGKINVKKPSAAQMITNLYTNSEKSIVTNNSISYQYDTTHSLMKDVGNNIRYYGASPNNYIYFNCSDYSNQTSDTCETWRIIGVFDGKVKIMRSESIGLYSFDVDANTFDDDIGVYHGSNDWPTSKLMRLLNEGFDDYQDLGKYNGTNVLANNSLYWNSASGNCFRQGNATLPIYVECDFTNIGLKNNKTKKLIATTTWHLGGINTKTSYPNQIYSLEQGTTVVSGHATEWIGKVTIPYVSDYGYASDLSLCTKTIDKYTDVSCNNNNWMLNIIPTINGYAIRFLTPNSKYATSGFHVEKEGYFTDLSSEIAVNRLIHPTLLLDTEIRLDETTAGTSTNPYKLIID